MRRMTRSTEDLREQLVQYGERRDEAIAEIARTSNGLGSLLAEARDIHPISMTEAARLAGVSRPLAYKLMKKSGWPD